MGEVIDLGEIRLLAGDLDGDGRVDDRDLAMMHDAIGGNLGDLPGPYTRRTLMLTDPSMWQTWRFWVPIGIWADNRLNPSQIQLN